MTDTTIPADDFTELVDADLGRVDLVGKAANGHRVLIAKEEVGPDEGPSDGGPDDTDLSFLQTDLSDAAEGAPMSVNTTAEIAKADGMEETVLEDGPAEVDLTEPLAEGTTDGVIGDELVPGSPAWESVDAATARKWTAVLSRAGNALEVLSEREGIEAASGAGDGDDSGNQWDLQDAKAAIDCAISILATYGVGEENEAVVGTEALDAVGKAAASIDLEQLAVLEEFAPVVKAGRVLSAANEGKIREATASLQSVLDTLPAPAVDDVAKEAPVPAPHSLEELVDLIVTEQVTKADAVVEPVAKADDPLASTSEADLRRAAITGSGSEQKAALQELGARVLMGTIGTDPAPEDEALEPAPDDEVGAPTAPVAVPTPEDVPAQPIAKAEDVLKSIIASEVERALTERDEQHALVVKGLNERIEELAGPAPSRVLSNGVLPQADDGSRPLPQTHIMRGQSASHLSPTVSIAKQEFADDLSAAGQVAKGDALQTAAIEALRQLHAR